MVDLAPFRGLRFDPAVVGDLAAVTAPPYDAIGSAEQERLYAASPYNVVRLELGQQTAADDDRDNRYTRAAATYRAWLADEVVRPDAEALYVYEQRFVRDGAARTQVGILGALAVTPWEAGEVLPHERIFRGPVEDRKRLLAALPANVSPVFVLVPRTPTGVSEVLDRAVSHPPLAAFTDADGTTHRLWAVADPVEHGSVARALATEHVLMADGHHRYTTALEHHGDRPGPGTDRVLAYVVGADRGPAIDAAHRLVRDLPPDVFDRLADLDVEVVPTDLSARALADGLADAPDLTFGLVTTAGTWMLRGRRAALHSLVADVAAPVDRLDIAVLQEVLLGPLQVPDRLEDLRYVTDIDEAAAEVRDGGYDALFLVRPVTFAQFQQASEARVLMPPKSTSFVPKPRTGLVLRPLDPANPGGGSAGR